MNKITIEGNTPHETIATMVALAAPHLAQAVKSWGDIADASLRAGSANARGTAPSLGNLQAADMAETSVPLKQADNDDKGYDEKNEVALKKPRGRGKNKKDDHQEEGAQEAFARGTSTSHSVVHPHGNSRVFTTIGEALEAMADFLDVCEDTRDVDNFLANNAKLIESAGHPGTTFLECAAERRKDLDPLPQGDQVGAKPQPEEMNLDIPGFLKKAKNDGPESAPAKETTIDEVRYAFLALATVKGTDPARLLLDGYQVKRVGELKSDVWSEFEAKCQQTSGLDATAWTAALVQAAAVAKAAQKKG